MSDTEIEQLKKDFSNQFSGVRSDIKELTKALHDLIRLDGDIKRQSDAVGRIGREVEDHEKRIRVLEVAAPGTKKSVGFMDKLFERSVFLIVGAVLMKFIGI